MRFKAVHLINYNLIVDSFVSILKPLDPGKFFKRIVRHNTLETLYDREVPREILPAELLPDEDVEKANANFKDLTGTSNKYIFEISIHIMIYNYFSYKTEKFRVDLNEHRETIMKMTDPSLFSVDESIKIGTTDSSYRKLGLD